MPNAVHPLRLARQAAGFSQASLAARVHLTTGALSKIENRHRQPRPLTRYALADALGLDQEVLFGPESP